MNKNYQLVEALMYVQGDIGISAKDLKDVTSMPILNARNILRNFKEHFNSQERGIFVIELGDRYKFATKHEFKNDIIKLVTIKKTKRLSQAAIETAGIIAYKQPITKTQINEIRGVSSEAVVNTLIVKGLIEEKGISESQGHPILYGVSHKFYDYFQIKSLSELPPLSEFNESEGVEDEFDLFSSQRES